MRTLSLLFAATVLFTGCGLLGGAKDLTAVEVTGLYTFTDYTIEPTASSVDSRDLLGRELPEEIALFLTETGEVRVERLRDDRVDETIATGRYVIRGREVRIEFGDLGDLGRDTLMPRGITFEADGRRLEADVFLEGVDLEAISDDYEGISRADVRLTIELRKASL